MANRFLTLQEIKGQRPRLPAWISKAYADGEHDIRWRIDNNPYPVFGPNVHAVTKALLFSLVKPGTKATAYVVPLFGENYPYDAATLKKRRYYKKTFVRPSTAQEVRKYKNRIVTGESFQSSHELALYDNMIRSPSSYILVFDKLRDWAEAIVSSTDPIDQHDANLGLSDIYVGYGHDASVWTWVTQEGSVTGQKRKRCPVGSRRNSVSGQCKKK
jgi:hypothetical protein